MDHLTEMQVLDMNKTGIIILFRAGITENTVDRNRFHWGKNCFMFFQKFK